jgi:NTE family protein
MSVREIEVVLSGGGAKTAAHLGAIRALSEAGLAPSRFVATSMGAVVAAGLAAGVEHEALLARLAEAGPRGISREPLAMVSGLFARSLLRPAPFRRAVEALVPARHFGELRLPLTVSVVDLDTGELLLNGAEGDDAPLVDVLCASCALPLYFPPYRWPVGAVGTAASGVCSRSRQQPGW